MNPFPGLRPFTQEEDYLFFGREEQTLELLQRLGTNRFVAVVGTSGSGKSSLVRCGLLSELLGGRMLDAGAAWEIAVTHPGGNPLALLTDALLEADLYDCEAEHVRENLLATLSRSHFGLVEAVKQADLGDGTNFLLVVDQFEEIFRFQDAGQRQQEAANEFVSLLLEAVAQKEVPIYVVLTMRSDFIGECGQFEGLAEMVNRGEFLIPRLTREQYKRVIEGPIKVAGGKIAPRLLQRLLNDLGQQADQLPCLQHALMRTWNVWAGRGDAEALDLDDYQRVGKMSQALSLHADEIYDSLASDRERELCQGIFQALTVEESNNRGIRRPQRLGRLCQILEVPPEELTPIIDAYRQSGVTFLMPSPEVELTEQTIIDISHESLMRVWTRLRQWVEEETQAAGIYHRLSESADLHEQGKAGLYRDPELGIALAWRESKRPNAPWAERYRPGFSTAMGFLEASQRASVAEEQAREAARKRELQQAQQLAEAQELRLEQQQRAARNLRKLVAGVAGIAGIAAVACVFALFARHEAGRQAEIAAARAEEARQNAEQAEHERATAEAAEAAAQRAEKRSREFRYATDIQLADRLIGDSHANARQVLDRLADHEPATGLASPSDDDLRGFEWHYLKRLVDSRGTIFATGEQPVSDTTLTTEGGLVTIDEDGLLHRWDTTTRRENRPPLELKPGRNSSAMALSRDGRLVALADAKAKQVHLVDVVTGTDVRPPIPAAALFGVIFSPDGQLLVTLDSKIAWWNTTTGTMIATQDSKLSEAGTLSVSADGLTVAVPGPGWCSVFRLDHAAAQITVLMDKQSADMGSPRTAAICPDGQSLFVSQMHTGTVSAFTISSGRGVKVTTFEQASSVSAFAFDPRGTSVATACVDGSIKIWPDWKALATAGAVPQEPMPLIGHRDEVSHITFAAAGNQVISASRDRTTRLWDLGLKVASVHRTLDGVAGRRARFSPDGLMIATADLQQGRIRLRDAETGQPVRDLPVTVEAGVYPEGIAFSPDNRLLAVGFGGKPNVSYIELWDIERGERLAVLPGTTDLPGFETTAGNGVVSTLSFSPDGRFLAAGFGAIKELTVGRMGQFPLKIYDVGSRRAIRYLLGHENYCTAVAFSRDGSRMASGSNDGTARIWDTATWKTLHVLQNPFRGDLIQKIFHDVAFSPTGDLLALASHDGTVQVWNPVNGELVQTLRGHTNGVTSVAFSPDGRTLASGSYESSVRLWNVATWREVMRLDPEIGVERHSVAFSPDGRQLLATGSPAILWTTQPLDDIPPEQAAGQLTVLLDSQVDFASYVRTRSGTGRWHDTLETLVRQRPSDPRVQGANAADRVNQFSSRQDWRQTAKSFDELKSIREHAPQEWFNTSDLLRLVTALIHENRLRDAASLLVGGEKRHTEDGSGTRAVGLGFQYASGKFPLTLTKVDRGSPAWNAGMRAGDLLVRFDEVELTPETNVAFSELLVKGKGTQVKLTIQHPGQAESVTVQPTIASYIRDDVSVELIETMLALVDQKLAESPREPELLELRAELAGQSSEYEKQVADYTAAIETLTGRGEEEAAVDLARLHRRRGNAYVGLKQWQPALDDYAKGITAETMDEELLANRARAQAESTLARHWMAFQPRELKSFGGSTLTKQDDNSILVSGTNPGVEVYTLVARPGLNRIHRIILEALPDPSLPNNGPGRVPSNGNFYLFEIRVFSAGVLVPLTDIVAEHIKSQMDPHKAIDGDVKTGAWTADGREGKKSIAVITTQLERAADDELRIELHFAAGHNLGRFRVTVTDMDVSLEDTVTLLPLETPADALSLLSLVHRLSNEQTSINPLVVQHPRSAGAVGDLFITGNVKDWQQAVEIYSLGITSETTDEELLGKRAKAYEELKDWKAAAADWSRAAKENPAGAKLLTDFAGRLVKAEQNALAAAQRERARTILAGILQADPGDAPAIDALAALLLDMSAVTEWTTLQPAELKAPFGQTLSVQEDESLVLEQIPYTLTLTEPGNALQAIRIETSPDETPPAASAVPFTEYQILSTDLPERGFRGRYVRIDLPGENTRFPRHPDDKNLKTVNLAEFQVFQGDKNIALGKPARQSSTSFPAERAVDGNTVGNGTTNSYAHTGIEENPWWEVDLGSEQTFDRMVVWNRNETNSDQILFQRMNHFRVQILDASRQVVFEQVIDAAPNPSTEITRPVELTKVEPDVADGNAHWQLSFKSQREQNPWRRLRISMTDEQSTIAVDAIGTPNVNWTVSRPSNVVLPAATPLTAQEDGSWIVGASEDSLALPVLAAEVKAIRVETASGSAANETGSSSFKDYRVEAINALRSESGGLLGRYVRLDLPGENTRFPRHPDDKNLKTVNLAEFQVFQGDKNIALGKPARQSSTSFPAERAVDGNTVGNGTTNSYAHTGIEENPWWEVDLGSEQTFDRMVVWNRNETNSYQILFQRMNHFRVQILDASRQVVFEQVIDKAPNPSREIDCRSLLVAKTPDAKADMPQWLLRLSEDSGFNPGGRFRISVTETESTPVPAAPGRVRPPTKIADPRILLAFAYARQGQTADAAIWAVKALDDATRIEGRMSLLEPLGEFPDLLAELRKTRHADPALQLAHTRSLTRRGTERVGQTQKDRSLPELTLARQEFTELLENYPEPEWTVLKPIEIKSQGGATLTPLEDGSILASGEIQYPEVYTLVARPGLEQIAGIRLEAIPDPSLPQNGPGRCTCGNFWLNELRLFSRGKPFPLLDAIVADDEAQEFRKIIDGRVDKIASWGKYQKPGEKHTAYLATRMTRAADDDLKIELHFARGLASRHNLGRFRVSVTNDPEALEAERRRIPLQIQESEIVSLDLALAKAQGRQGNTSAAADTFARLLNQTGARADQAQIIAAAVPLPGVLEQLAARAPGNTAVQVELFRKLETRGRQHLADKQFESAVADLQQCRKLFASLRSGETNWTVLSPSELKSKAGTTLTFQSDGSILASGASPDFETYTIVAPLGLARVTAVRLESLPHSSLPYGGSGRDNNGYGGVSNLTVARIRAGGTLVAARLPLQISDAVVSHNRDNKPAFQRGVDGRFISGWDMWPEVKRPQSAVFELRQQTEDPAATSLVVELSTGSGPGSHGTLGCFRISVTDDPTAFVRTAMRRDLKDNEIAKLYAALAQAQAQYGQTSDAIASFTESLHLSPDRTDKARIIAAAAALATPGSEQSALDDSGRAMLRRQALEWMTTELAAWSKLLESATPQERLSIIQALTLWNESSDLASLRDPAATRADLPEAEQQAFTRLWADAAALLSKAEKTSFRALPAAEQVEAVRAELKKRNSGKEAPVESVIENGVVVQLTINPPGYRDLSPIRAIPELPRLHLSGAEVTDLSPLRGMNLTTLELHSTSVFDLSPLEGMKLRHLHIITANKLRDLSPLRGTPLESLTIYGAPVIDLTPLKEMKLTYLNCDSSQVTDLSPLKDVPLTSLLIHNTKVSDLSPIRGMPLGTLVMLNSKVSDLSPLRGMQVTNLQVQGAPVTDLSPLVDLPLTEVQCDFQPARDARVLRAIKTLAKINTQPAADFWKEVDRPLAQRLPAVLRGEDQPANNAERLDFARIAYDAKQYTVAARLWAETLESDPQAGDDRLAQIRYQAARAAVLAAAGQGQGELPEDDAATAKLRRQALAWLQAELATWTQALEAGSSPIPTRAVRALTGWTQDVDLAGLRDAQALAGLPAAERNAWRALWTDVAAVTDKAALLTQQEDERLLEQDPGNRAAATQLARGLLEQQERRDATRWTVLKPTDLKSEASATLKLLPDGSILSSGMHPNRDDYTIEVPVDLKNITAIALDILPHEIHGGNVGRGTAGGFILSEIDVSLRDKSGRQMPVVMNEAVADYEGTVAWEMVRYVIDGQNDDKGWGTPDKKFPHRLVVKPEHPITGSSTVLRIALRQNHFNDAHKLGLLIGRFRLSATDDPRALDQERSRFAVPKITDPWAKLAAAYVLAGDTQRAADLLARSVEKIDIAALLDSGCLTHEVVDSLQARHPDSCAGLFPRLALSAGERGKIELARDLYERLVELQPETELWKERVEQYRAGAIAVWNFDTEPVPWGSNSDCQLVVQNGVLTARTTGGNPHIVTSASGPAGGKAVVLRYRTDEPFTMQVYWGDSTGAADESRKKHYPIPATTGEWREITLPFWCQGTLNALRLDPNTAKEHPLEIDSIVLRQVEPAEAWNQASDGATRTAIFEAVSRNDDLLLSLVEQFPDAPQWQFALARSLTARGQQALTAGQIDQAISLLQQAQQAYARVSAPTQWTVLTPTEFSSVGGETFTAENDGSIFVSGPNPDRAVYTLKLKTELHTVTAIRLETIPDPRLPQGGAGRYRENGNFHVSELTSAIVSGDAQESSTPIVISSVIVDNKQAASAQNMLDGNPQTRWDTYPNRGPHWAVFGMTTPVQVDGGSLSITLDSGITEWGQHGLGRFRLLVTGETDAFTRTEVFASLNPNEIADASVALASAQAHQGQKKEALASFAQAIELATDRAGQARVIAAAAPLPGMLEILAKRGAGNGQFQAELARHFAEQGDASSAAAAQTIARALFEQRLAAAPDDAELASELARLLLSPATDSDATRWRVLQPTEMKSEKGATLTLQADGSILASGTNTAGDVYTLRAVADVDRIAAVRLEAMPDSSLPNQGPGRHSSGNFQLTAFRVYDAENDGGSGLTPLPLASAWASFDYKANDADIAGIVDETVKKVWHVWGRFGEAHQAVFGVAKTAAAASRGRPLVIELRHKDFGEGINLGRFRLAVNADPDAFDREQNRSAAMKIVDPWVKLATAYRLVGDQSALDKLFERHPAAAAGVGDQYAAEKNWERAIALYGRVITDATTDVALLSKRAAAHVGAGNWNLAQVDWWRIVAQQPDQAQAAFDAFRNAERWNEAAEFGLQLVQQKRESLSADTLVWLRVAPILALVDDQEVYASFCDRMARHFADSDLPEVLERIIKAALLRPDSIDLAKLPGIRLGKILDAGIGPDGLLPLAWGSRALWAYRSGDAASAVKFVSKSEELKPAEVAHALNLNILALAQIRLERLDEARQTLKLAQDAIQKLEADPSKRDHDLLIARILYREAEGLIDRDGKK